MNLRKPIEFRRTGPCWIHSPIDVITHSSINIYLFQGVDQPSFKFIGGIRLDGSVSVGIFCKCWYLLTAPWPS